MTGRDEKDELVQPALPLDLGEAEDQTPDEDRPFWWSAKRTPTQGESEAAPDGARVLVGTCNWADHESFYPPGTKPIDRLAFYARHFPIVEIDATFYAIQPTRNFERWAKVTPDAFAFNVKAYRELTGHDREKEPEAATFEAFHRTLQPLRDAGKLRAVHFQFPPWFVATERNRDYILTARDFFPGDTFAVEFRNRSWFTASTRAQTLDFLQTNGLVHVMVDAPQVGSGTVPKVVAVTSPSLAMVRFHGRNTATWYKKVDSTGQRFDYLYTKDELAEWLPSIREAAAQAREVHVMMNNNRADYAVRNGRDFMDLLGQQTPLAEDAQPGLGPWVARSSQHRLRALPPRFRWVALARPLGAASWPSWQAPVGSASPRGGYTLFLARKWA